MWLNHKLKAGIAIGLIDTCFIILRGTHTHTCTYTKCFLHSNESVHVWLSSSVSASLQGSKTGLSAKQMGGGKGALHPGQLLFSLDCLFCKEQWLKTQR